MSLMSINHQSHQKKQREKETMEDGAPHAPPFTHHIDSAVSKNKSLQTFSTRTCAGKLVENRDVAEHHSKESWIDLKTISWEIFSREWTEIESLIALILPFSCRESREVKLQSRSLIDWHLVPAITHNFSFANNCKLILSSYSIRIKLKDKIEFNDDLDLRNLSPLSKLIVEDHVDSQTFLGDRQSRLNGRLI
jgi:hypothetical protein